MAGSNDDRGRVTPGGTQAPRERALTTAYASNTRGDASAPGAGSEVPDHGWSAAINRLVATDHAFLPLSCASAGCLFRGVDCDAADSLLAGNFAITRGAHPLNALERELGVVLVSAHLSDAVSVARLWEPGRDACVIAIHARYFARQAALRRAAVLAFAEPGVVFSYPFLDRPIPARALACAFVRADAGGAVAITGASGRVAPLVTIPGGCDERHACEARISEELARRGLHPAILAPGGTAPARRPLV